jgi:hypothetical protein
MVTIDFVNKLSAISYQLSVFRQGSQAVGGHDRIKS